MEKRKALRLPEYCYNRNGAYFITICTKKRRQCLSRIVGADAYIGPHAVLTKWGDVVERYIHTIPGIDTYVIMPSRCRVVGGMELGGGPVWSSPPTQSVSDRIRSFKTLVSKQIGHSIWQRSFYDHVIRNEEDYLHIWQYIDRNPAKWAEDEYYYAE